MHKLSTHSQRNSLWYLYFGIDYIVEIMANCYRFLRFDCISEMVSKFATDIVETEIKPFFLKQHPDINDTHYRMNFMCQDSGLKSDKIDFYNQQLWKTTPCVLELIIGITETIKVYRTDQLSN